MGAVIVIVLLIVFLALMEYMRVSQTIINVKNTVDEAVIKTAVNNNYSTFHGRKQSEGRATKRSIDNTDVENVIKNILKLDDSLIKKNNNGTTLYKLQNINSSYVNQVGQNINFTTTLKLTVNINLLNVSIPLKFNLNVHSRYIKKF